MKPDLVADAAASSAARRFAEGCRTRAVRLGIVGLGYVGLPLARAAAERGFRVIGFDIDPAKVEALGEGRSYLSHIAPETLAPIVASGHLSATADLRRLGEADAILICVPTPLGPHREPDLSFVVATAETIARHLSYVERTADVIARTLRPGQLIELESTTYPGTTREIVKPILEAAGLRSGRDFHLAYSPEREDPGNAEYGTAAIPRVVGGDGTEATAMAAALYREIVVEVVEVSSLETAEAVKLTENIFRAVNIALVNELKVVYGAMGIDIWEVIEAARTKPFGFMPFYPGPGIGGHCIPVDPFYLTWKAREYDIDTRFIELAGEVNRAMPRHVVERLAMALDAQARRGLNGAEILIVGLAYKANVDDLRESPSLRLIEMIEERGARVSYHDPYIPVIPPTREHGALAGRRSIAPTPDAVAAFDAVLIATDHDEVDTAALAASARLVVDTRNACARAGITGPHIVKA